MNSKALPYLLLLPATLFLLVFFVYPFVQIAVLAFSGPEGLTLSLIYTTPSPRDRTRYRMPSYA